MTAPPPRDRMRRRRPTPASALIAAVGVLASVAVLAAGQVAPAWAHPDLVASEPEDDERVTDRLETVRLEFDEPVDVLEVRVTGPQGEPAPTGEATVDESVAIQPLDQLGRTGDHLVRYRVAAADGHTVDGEFSFVYLGPTGDDEAETTEPAEEGEEPPVLAPWWPLLAVGGALLAVLAAGLWSWRQLGQRDT